VELGLRDNSVLYGIDKDTGELRYCKNNLTVNKSTSPVVDLRKAYKLAIEYGVIGIQYNEHAFRFKNSLIKCVGNNDNLVWSDSDYRVYFDDAKLKSSEMSLIYFIEDVNTLGGLRKLKLSRYSRPTWIWGDRILKQQYILEVCFIHRSKIYFILWCCSKSCFVLLVLNERLEALQKSQLSVESISELGLEEVEFDLHNYSFDDIFIKKVDFLKQRIF